MFSVYVQILRQTFLILRIILLGITTNMPVPVAVRSKASVCGRSPAEIVGSNPTGGHGYLSVVSVVCCQVEISATS